MKYRIVHKTSYAYSEPASLFQTEARLTPRTFKRQNCMNSKFNITPQPVNLRKRTDFFGNTVQYFAIDSPHKNLLITVTSDVEIKNNDSQLSQDIAWEEAVRYIKKEHNFDALEARSFVLDSPLIVVTQELLDYGMVSFPPGRPLIEAVQDLMTRIFKDFSYSPGFTTITTPLSQVMKHRRGVCQDFAHLAIGCLRAMKLAARYISGYIETIPPPGKPKLVGADASHAWFSVYVPDVCWIDFDPTNNQIPENRHITVAWGRDYSDVPPLKGVFFGGGTHELRVSVDVEPTSQRE